jgi:GPN-loop GTPase
MTCMWGGLLLQNFSSINHLTNTTSNPNITLTMSRFGVLVMGPAGAGKSTFCAALIQHIQAQRRSAFYVNLDPAADAFAVAPDLDIKDLISLDDAMTELELGPNGGLIACFEYLAENMEFVTDPLSELPDDYLVVIDMPGQIELYTHIPIIPMLTKELEGSNVNMRLCATYLLEATFVIDRAKFFSGTLSAMSAMLLMGLPHINILSKMDLVKGMIARKELKKFFTPEPELLEEDERESGAPWQKHMLKFQDDDEDDEVEATNEDPTTSANKMKGSSFAALNKAVANLIDEFGLVSFLQLDVRNEDSVGAILSYIDDTIQFHEAQEPKEPKDEDYNMQDEE